MLKCIMREKLVISWNVKKIELLDGREIMRKASISKLIALFLNVMIILSLCTILVHAEGEQISINSVVIVEVKDAAVYEVSIECSLPESVNQVDLFMSTVNVADAAFDNSSIVYLNQENVTAGKIVCYISKEKCGGNKLICKNWRSGHR